MVSIIVPVYNVERYLCECLDSICHQTHTDLEVILVDDGSTDSSGAICEAYSATDNRFKVIRRKNSGPSAARNFGLDITMGEWIMFVDSDDIISPMAVEQLLKLALNTKADIAVAPFAEFTDIGRLKFSDRVTRKATISGSEAAMKILYQTGNSLGLTCSAWSKLFRRELFDGLRFTEGLIYEDLEFVPRIVANARCVSAIDACCYGYRRNPDSLLGRFDPRRFDVLTACRRLQEHFAADRALSRAAADRTLSAAFNMLMLMGRHSYNDTVRADECCDIIRANRLDSLRDKNARLRNKAGILLSYIIGPEKFVSPFLAHFLRR